MAKDNRESYENESLGVSFKLPAILTVRQQIQYMERIWTGEAGDTTLRFWDGVQPIIEDWECETIPDLDALDLDTATDPKVTSIVFWVANRAAEYFMDKEYVPKNA